jgi:hypothetical protein
MKELFKVVLFLAIFFIVIKDINEYVNYRLNIQVYDIMAKKYNCTFLTPSASRSDVGMFDCQGKITFKKLESE